jgi:hypothetical protein
VAFLVGFIIIGHSLMKVAAKSKTKGGQLSNGEKEGYTPQLISMLIGGALMSFAMMVNLGTDTLTGGQGYLDFEYASTNPWKQHSQQMAKVLVLIVNIAGYWAFFQGWLSLNKAAQGSDGGQSTYGQGFGLIVGGIAAINVAWIIQLVAYTLGLGAELNNYINFN